MVEGRGATSVLTGAMGTIGEWTPLRPAIEMIQDGWRSLDPVPSWLVGPGPRCTRGAGVSSGGSQTSPIAPLSGDQLLTQVTIASLSPPPAIQNHGTGGGFKVKGSLGRETSHEPRGRSQPPLGSAPLDRHDRDLLVDTLG